MEPAKGNYLKGKTSVYSTLSLGIMTARKVNYYPNTEHQRHYQYLRE